jgi:hypothetical protein
MHVIEHLVARSGPPIERGSRGSTRVSGERHRVRIVDRINDAGCDQWRLSMRSGSEKPHNHERKQRSGPLSRWYSRIIPIP